MVFDLWKGDQRNDVLDAGSGNARSCLMRLLLLSRGWTKRGRQEVTVYGIISTASALESLFLLDIFNSRAQESHALPRDYFICDSNNVFPSTAELS